MKRPVGKVVILGDDRILRLWGDLDAARANDLRRVLAHTLRTAPHGLAVDLTSTGSVAEECRAVLDEFARHAEETGVPYRLVETHDPCEDHADPALQGCRDV